MNARSQMLYLLYLYIVVHQMSFRVRTGVENPFYFHFDDIENNLSLFCNFKNIVL